MKYAYKDMCSPHNKCILQQLRSSPLKLKIIILIPLTSVWTGCTTLGGNFLASSPNKLSTLCLWKKELGSSFFFLSEDSFFSVTKYDEWERNIFRINYSYWLDPHLTIRQGLSNNLEIICNLKDKPGSSFSENSQEYPFDGWYRE